MRIRELAAGLFALIVLLAAGPAGAQQEGAQYVESLEQYQRKIEGLINERLSALVPSGNFVLKAQVQGTLARVPRATPRGTGLDLPGFRPATGEAVGGEEKYRVDQVSVRIVLNEQLPDSDLQYIRTIVPILADFRPERGDTLQLRTIAPTPGRQAGAETAEQAPPQVAQLPGPQEPGSDLPLGLTKEEWLLIGAGLLALLLAIAFLRVLFVWTRPKEPEPAPAPPPPPPTPSEVALRHAEEERRHVEEERNKAEQEHQLNNLKHGVVRTLFARPELGQALVQDWSSTPGKLNALIHALGPVIARPALMPHLGRDQYLSLEEKVRTERDPEFRTLVSTLRDANVYLIAQELVHPESIRPNPFRFLDNLSWGQTAFLIKDEPVRVKAIVLSRIEPADTARILETYPKDAQLEIAVNIGNLRSLPLEMLEGVGEALAEKARHVPDQRTLDIEGPQALADLMTRTSARTSTYLLKAMKAKDTRLSEEVERRFFLFDAIPLVPDDVLPQVVRTMPSNTVITALQGAPQEIQRKVIMAFPEQARSGLVTTLRAARYEPEQIEDARLQVVRRFQILAQQGRIDLKQISDAWQAQQTRAS